MVGKNTGWTKDLAESIIARNKRQDACTHYILAKPPGEAQYRLIKQHDELLRRNSRLMPEDEAKANMEYLNKKGYETILVSAKNSIDISMLKMHDIIEEHQNESPSGLEKTIDQPTD